jgi:glycosyltransferase involved in cell wall biosynthesis
VTAAEVQPLRVAIDARIPYGAWGGVQQVVEGLATGFAKLDGPEEYFFLVEGGGTEWLGPLIGRNSRAVKVPADFGRTAPRRLYDALMRGSPLVARVAQGAASRLGGASLQLPRSTGFVEGLGVDLVHFATPQAYLTKLPSIYQPHDLLYRSFPEQFAPVHARYRDHAYRAFSARASVVAVMTEFGRHEVLQAYGLPADRVAVVPWAPVAGPGRSPTSAEAIPGDLPERFVLYPAQTWPHKNHVRLLEALAALREKGLVIPLVSTGRQTGHMAEIRRRIDQLRLADQVRFLGFLPPKDFDAVLARSTAVVFPSLFEGWGLPVVEAFAAGVPVACSNTTALPEVARDAALLFEPTDPRAIAAAIERVWGDEPIRADLRRRGTERVAQLTWERTARTFRAIYRHVANRELWPEDRELLAPPTFQASS